MPGRHFADTVALWSTLPRGDGKQVLDLSVSDGRSSRALLELGYAVTCTNYDPERPASIPAEARYVGGLDLNEPFPFDDESFDGVNIKDVFEHLENPTHVLRECARVLRPGGVLAFSTPNMFNAASRVRFLFTGYHEGRKRPVSYAKQLGKAANIYVPTFVQVHYLLAQTGFRIEMARMGIVEWRTILFAIPLWLPVAASTWVLTRRVRRQSLLSRTVRRSASKEHLDLLHRRQMGVARDLFRWMVSPQLMLGRNLILRCRRTDREPNDFD
ncbi:MAG: class I SAM-dependent methyltransferase [Candidatus Sumerlaeia bacterium]|nr:class I SAM-dependent methyltransferase [Candidatus Sumerlaeia bacterium]